MMNCWEFMKCGREVGGKNAGLFGVCPAFPNNGNSCSEVEGTFCDLVLKLIDSEYISCQDCKFYKSRHYSK